METLIRQVTENDFEKVFPLFKQLWPDKVLDRSALQTVFNRGINSETDDLLCMVVDHQIVGFCSYAIVNNLWQEGYIAYMYALVIDQNLRGKGLGAKLIKEVIHITKRRGMKRVELDSGFHRENAHKFYLDLGFEKRAFLFSFIL